MIGRIRSVKPEIFAHYLLWHLGELTDMPKLAYWYIGLWCMTDREARLEWKPMELKAALAPYDDVDFARVLNVLANAGFIVRYKVGARLYGWLPRFLTHQNINGREQGSRLPAPPANASAWHEDHHLAADFEALTLAQLLDEPSTLSASSAIGEGRVGDASVTRDARDTYRTEQNRTEQNGTEQSKDMSTAGAGRRVRPHRTRVRAVDTLVPPDELHAGGAREHSEGGAEGAAGGVSPLVRSADALDATRPAETTLDAPAPAVEGSSDGHPSAGGGMPYGIPSTGVVLAGPVHVVDDSARNVQALPAVVGKATGVAIAGRMSKVLAELHEGSRTRLKKEQMEKLQADLVFLYWQAVFDHPHAIMDDKRRARIVARLRENGGNLDELCYALDGAARDEFIMGKGGGTKYDGIETVLRDRGQVERFAARRKGYTNNVPHKGLAKLEAALRGETPTQEASDGNG